MKTREAKPVHEPPLPPRERLYTAKIEVHQNRVTVAVTCRFFDHEGNPTDPASPRLEVVYRGDTTATELYREDTGVYAHAFDAQRGGYDLRLTSDGQRAAKAERFVWVS